MDSLTKARQIMNPTTQAFNQIINSAYQMLQGGAKGVVSNLNPNNYNTPIAGPIRKFNRDTFGVQPMYDESLPADQRIAAALNAYSQNFIGHGEPINLNSLAKQEALHGTPLRTTNPYQGSVDVPGLHQISIVKKGGDVVKRMYYDSLNNAKKAMEGIVVKDNQTALGPVPIMFKQ
jgi:hypothetical protein